MFYKKIDLRKLYEGSGAIDFSKTNIYPGNPFYGKTPEEIEQMKIEQMKKYNKKFSNE